MGEPDLERRRLAKNIARLQRASSSGFGTAPAGRAFSLLKLGALVAGTAAGLLVALVVLRRGSPVLLLFAAGLSFYGARLWWRSKRRPSELPGGAAADEEWLRTEAALGKLREALDRAPVAVRRFVQDARRAIEAISRGAAALASRAAWLEEVVRALGAAPLEAEHAGLSERLKTTADPTARRLLQQALAASTLKAERAQELVRYSERVFAEQLRIRHALEALYLDVERAVAADRIRSQADATSSLTRLANEIRRHRGCARVGARCGVSAGLKS